jgi:hypothetical protein
VRNDPMKTSVLSILLLAVSLFAAGEQDQPS